MNTPFVFFFAVNTLKDTSGFFNMVLLIYGVRLPPLCQKPHINLLGRVTDQVFSESEEWDIDTVSETIASEYERATNLSINKEKQNLPIEEKRTIDVKEIREWLNFIITIISVDWVLQSLFSSRSAPKLASGS